MCKKKTLPPHPNIFVQILGVRISNESFDEVIERLWNVVGALQTTAVFLVNAHTLNIAAADPTYRCLLNESELIFGDGTGVRWAALLRGVRMKANFVGTDLVPALLSSDKGIRCYLLGHTPDGITRAAEHVVRAYPSCTLVGFHHGYLDDGSTSKVIDAINAGSVDLLLVGMGNPLQEQWIGKNRTRLKARLCLGVGGLFSYWAGELDRAPPWMRRHGIEWMHILRRQPWKFRRFVLGNPLFVFRMLLWLPADLRWLVSRSRPESCALAGNVDRQSGSPALDLDRARRD